jgi:hypothetical protein
MTRKQIDEIKKRYHCPYYRSLVIEEIRSGLLTIPQARQRYSLTYWKIRQWNRWYYRSRLAPYFQICLQPVSSTTMKNATQEIEQLKKQLAESATRIEQLELEKVVLNTVIQIAEKELNVDIRKKYGYKQLGK